MKASKPGSEDLSNHNKQDLAVFVIGILAIGQVMYFLCKVMRLYDIVFISASVISIVNAFYYGVIWRDLKKLLRLGLAIFFLIMSAVGVVLYRLSLQIDEASQAGIVLLAQLFGFFIVGLTLVFIYKHKSPSFWDWG